MTRLLLLFLAVCLLLPTQNSTLDAYDYANSIRSGQLFAAHHLLYNAWGYVVWKPLAMCGWQVNILSLMKVLNTLAAAACLPVFYQILTCQSRPASEAKAYTWFVAACFGFLRFATENETYIVPLLWSLAGSLFLLKYFIENKPGHLFLSGLLLAASCLFHQVHVWWWLAGLAVVGFSKKGWLYLLPACIVPAAYLLVVYTTEGSPKGLFQFMFYDYLHGSAQMQVSWQFLPLAVVSLARAVVQVHGSIWVQVQHSWFWFLPALVSIGLSVFFVWKIKPVKLPASRQPFLRFLLLAAILQFLFATFSAGNTEFMTMMPFLLVLLFASRYHISARNIHAAATALVCWNVAYGLLPARFYSFENREAVAAFIRAQPATPFVASDYWFTVNVFTYLYRQPPANVYSGLWAGVRPLNPKGNLSCFTDVPNKPLAGTRKTWMGAGNREMLLSNQRLPVVFSCQAYWGAKHVYHLRFTAPN